MQLCADVNCPKHGTLRVRGAIIEGVIVSDKPKNTVIVQREYLNYVPKYERYERRRTKVNAHKPPCVDVKTGDRVRIGECRKVSKTKSFVVIEKLK
ncbi:30S ribosomal protein S17 [Candidatus Micrarchaeota archaeon]|nr:30S ribosomal protein S17 [Candidatus Micrarchaeota archaeon]